MRQVIILVLVLGFAVGGLAMAKTLNQPVRWSTPEQLTGLEDLSSVQFAPPAQPSRRVLDDPIVPVYIAGTTWYDMQANGTIGRQLAVDPMGFVHSVWMKGFTSDPAGTRHVFYNLWSPDDLAFLLPDVSNPVGNQIDGSPRAGYINVAVNHDGLAMPFYHRTEGGANAWAEWAMDITPQTGVFINAEIPRYTGNPQLIWPHCCADIAGNVHAVVFESSPPTGQRSRAAYIRGIPYFNTQGESDSISFPGGWVLWPLSYDISLDVAASWHSSRIAVAYSEYLENWTGVNVMIRFSEDGGLNWQDPIRITEYPVIDTTCNEGGGRAVECNGDTVRPAGDVSVVFDANDFAHVAFSTEAWFYWWPATDSVGPWTYVGKPGIIWHWDEVHNEYNIICDNWIIDQSGARSLMVFRPSLAIDTATNYLYCGYQKFDSAQWSSAGFDQADAFVTVSHDGGRTWAEGTNVSQTNGGQNTPPPDCMSERDITLAPLVTNGIVHMQYEIDHDAGTCVFTAPSTEGIATENEIIYAPVPVSMIPHRPLVNPYRVLRLDSTGYPFGLDTTDAVGEHSRSLPGQFTLYQNYPNPFNAVTNIQFDLASESVVSLRVYDILGREAATIFDHARLTAGVHMQPFDASKLASGVYLYRLETPSASTTRKMILMK
jgi:hypothetical protein